MARFSVKPKQKAAKKGGRKLTAAQRGSIDFSGAGKSGGDRYDGYVPRQR